MAKRRSLLDILMTHVGVCWVCDQRVRNGDGSLVSAIARRTQDPLLLRLCCRSCVGKLPSGRSFNHGSGRSALRRRLIAEEGVCWFCGIAVTQATGTLDHFIPRIHRGSDREENLRLACANCNTKKADQPAQKLVCLIPRGRGIITLREFYQLETIREKQEMFKKKKNELAVADEPEVTLPRNTLEKKFYKTLDKDEALVARKNAHAIHKLLARTAADIIEIGRRLICVKAKLNSVALFTAWLELEFRWKRSSAYNFMRVTERFGDLDCLENIQPTALYELARDSVDNKAVDEALEMAKGGHQITPHKAREIIERHSEAPPPEPPRRTEKPNTGRWMVRDFRRWLRSQDLRKPDPANALAMATELDKAAVVFRRMAEGAVSRPEAA